MMYIFISSHNHTIIFKRIPHKGTNEHLSTLKVVTYTEKHDEKKSEHETTGLDSEELVVGPPAQLLAGAPGASPLQGTPASPCGPHSTQLKRFQVLKSNFSFTFRKATYSQYYCAFRSSRIA